MKKFLFLLLIIFIVIQFIKPAKNIHPGKQPNNISTLYNVPSNVDEILTKACKDCHSNNTYYPWYFNVQPVAWWMADHINTGKFEINFDEFAAYPIHEQYSKLNAVKGQVQKNQMPLPSYTWIHKDAILTNAEKNILIGWAENIRNQLEAKYPVDSLKNPDDDQPFIH